MKTTTIVFAICALFIQHSLADDGAFVDHIKSMKGNTYRVETKNGEFLGTAFKLNAYGHMITCEHVVNMDCCCRGSLDTVYVSGCCSMADEDKNDTNTARKDARFVAEVIHRIPAYDLAIIQIDTPDPGTSCIPTRPLWKSENLEEGMSIAICAYIPDDYPVPKPFIAKGIISTIRNTYRESTKNNVELLQLDLSVSKGTSGGPIFSTDNGYIIGYLSGGIFESEEACQTPYAEAFSISQIIPLLDSLHIPVGLHVK